MTRRDARRAVGTGGVVWAFVMLGSLVLTVVFWVIMIKLGIAGIHYLNRH
jgi:hypothetical protein